MVRGLLVCLSLVFLASAQNARINRQGFAQPGLNPRHGFRQFGGFTGPSARRQFHSNRQGSPQPDLNPSGPRHGFQQFGGFTGPSIRGQFGNPGGFRGLGRIAVCSKYCHNTQGEPYCCGFTNGTLPNVVTQAPAAVTHPGHCPPARYSCPVARRGPDPCSSDGDCAEFHKCCFETCLGYPICKPVGCVLNGKVYQDKAINEDSCLIMQCNKGAWEYIQQIRNNCGNCTVEGDPHFRIFDETTFLTRPSARSGRNYEFGGEGNYVITQNGLESSSTFGVNADFQPCNTNSTSGLPCVQNITYYEPGITVAVELPDLKVRVNGNVIPLTPIGKTEAIHGNDGTVLVFNHNHNGNDANVNCMNVVGSQDLSVSLCQENGNFAYLSVLPMQTLGSQLYGLCNTYTGTTRTNLTTSGGVLTQNLQFFVTSWDRLVPITEIPTQILRS